MTGARELLAVTETDRASVTALAAELIRIPSRGGIDPYGPVLDRLAAWLAAHRLPVRQLHDPAGTPVGLVCELDAGRPGPRLVLDACVDTAPFGDENAWTHPPTSATVRDGWLWGRGAADSKTGAAIFCHLLVRLAPHLGELRGGVSLLLDADEHTGGFGGARAYFAGPDAPTTITGVMIGYPGMEHLVVGGRGLLRARLHVHGVASHSGGSRPTANAVVKAAELVGRLVAAPLPAGQGRFPAGGKLTVTEIIGGQSWSLTPDLCTVCVDLRLTPAFDAAVATDLLRATAADLDTVWPDTHPTRIQVETHWPPYALDIDAALPAALLTAARCVGLPTLPKVAGPSNIGNYLAGLGIPATAGFGVAYEGMHAADERIRLDTIPPVQAAYHAAVLTLLR
ncbi:M20/M25/M40 family metallo-hydrolase [Frankia sp. Cppng1_Ct_nod]|uniref:M20 family metallopeptidase n=1 Tax=Frankia sp. Cppng1_Ct_nod TaxID=2897162 RepID=UPI001041A353|nr:M20/M25/M40 family metallo-hydrolase [Frankia sp. Cppng1_Ct_nod]